LDGQYELLKQGTFVVLKCTGETRKATVFMYVCSIQNVPDPTNESSEVDVMGFIFQDRKRTIFTPRHNDLQWRI